MNVEYYITIVLDKRREKKNKKYPVKLRVFTPNPRKQILYPTKFEFSESEFNTIWTGKKLNQEQKEVKLLLRAIETKAEKAAAKLQYFSFEAFEKELFNDKAKGAKDVCHYYNEAIVKYKKNRQIGTASNYQCSINSLMDFHKEDKLKFSDITPQWLTDYENYLIDSGKSLTTVGMYLRPLRAVFNTAVSDKVARAEQYPFGKKRYNIPAPGGFKKALSKDQLKMIFEAEPDTPEQAKAKAFWFFSYSCNGANFKDISGFQYKNISGDVLTFTRSKTAHTNKKQSPVIVYLNDYTRSVIEKYGNHNISPETYIFPMVNHADTPEMQHRQIQNFVRYVNQHFGKFTKSLGIEDNVSTYWARHTFATTAIRKGASLEFVSEALSHSSLKTTIGYFAGFEDEKKREIANKMMEF